MNELKVTGTQSFMGVNLPVILGGFGEGKKCISDKTIAEIHGMKVFHVRELISNNIKRFKVNIDYIDMKQRIGADDTSESERILLADTLESERVGETGTLELLLNLGYAKQSITQAEHIYILSERGYAKLIKIMDTDLAWEVHDKLMDEYFTLRGEKKNTDDLSPLLRFMIKTELEQKKQAEEIASIKEQSKKAVDRVESIRDVVALNPNDWRKETSQMINKMAQQAGGYEHIKAIREESYKLLEQRMGVALNIRLTNKKKTMSLNGVCKSKIDKLNQLDVIADDKKLIEGYVSIVKEMVIRYGAA